MSDEEILSDKTRIVLSVTLFLVGIGIATGAAVIDYDTPANNVTMQTNNGLAVTYFGERNLSSQNTEFVNNKTVRFVSESGNISFSHGAQQSSSLTVTRPTGFETRLRAISISAPITVDPEDKPSITLSNGDTNTFEFRTMALSDGEIDFQYNGTFNGGFSVTVRGLEANRDIIAIDSNGITLDESSTNSNGVATLDMPNDNAPYSVQLLDDGSATGTNGDEDPTLSDPNPVGILSNDPDSLDITVGDPEFPNDNVSVNVSLDGSQVGTRDVDSQTRISIPINQNFMDGTAHTWTVNATDREGNTERAQYEFAVPGNATIFNETEPEQPITNIDITARIYYKGDLVFNRSTTNGTLPLNGLPNDSDVVLELNTTDYHRRTYVIEDISNTPRIYMLPLSEDSVEVRFRLNDPTGEFPKTFSQLFIKRALTVNNTTRFQQVAGDWFGAEPGLTVDLEEDTRYRLVLKNPDDDVRVLGDYGAPQSETVTLSPDNLELSIPDTEGYNWNFEFDNSTGNPVLRYQYMDPQDETTNLEVTIHERGNPENTFPGYPQTYFGPLGTVSIEEPLTDAQANKSWVVVWDADRNGDRIDDRDVVSENPRLFQTLPGWIKMWTSLGIVLMTGALFSRANITIGAPVTSITIGIFWWIGWFGNAVTSVGVIIALGMSAYFWAGRPDGGGI